MADIDDYETEVSSGLEPPIDLAAADRSALSFYLAAEIPLQVSDFAANCREDESRVRELLRDRFGTIVTIDSTGFLGLSGDARRPVIKAGKPFLKTGQDLYEQGKALADDNEYDQAVPYFDASVTVLEGVRDRFAAVDYNADQIEDLIDAAARFHDSSLKEVTKDTINHRAMLARQHKSEGDRVVDSDPAAAATEYREARTAYTEAIDAVTEYNRSMHSNGTPQLSTESLEEHLETIEGKIEDCPEPATEGATAHDSELTTDDSRTHESEAATENGTDHRSEADTEDSTVHQSDPGTEDSPVHESKSTTEDSTVHQSDSDDAMTTLDEVADEINGFGRASLLQLRKAGFDSLSDLRDVSVDDLTAVDKIGPTTAEDLLRYAKQRGIDVAYRTPEEKLNKFSASSKTGGDSTLSLRELKSRVDKHYRQDESEGGDWYRCQRTTADGSVCNTKVHFSTTAPGDLRKHEQKHSNSNHAETIAEDHSTRPNSDSTSDDTVSEDDPISIPTKPDELASGPDPTEILEPSAFETSWETISGNERVDGQLLLKVEGIHTPNGDRKTAILDVVERTGKGLKLDIWETHDLHLDWAEGEWYAVRAVRGTVWETDSSGVQKRLSSTKDLKAKSLGAEFDPETFDGELDTDTSSSAQRDQPGSTPTTAETPPEPSGGTDTVGDIDDMPDEPEEAGIFGEIMSDFDEM